MALATYPRKGSIARSNVKALLETDSVFNQLTDTQQNTIIDSAVQRLAAYRNSLSKDDYKFDTVGNPDIVVTILEYAKYARYVIIEAGVTYKNVLYAAATVLEEQAATGFSNPITNSRLANVVEFSCAGEFDSALLTDTHYAPVIVTNVSNDRRQIDVTNSDGVVIVEFFMR